MISIQRRSRTRRQFVESCLTLDVNEPRRARPRLVHVRRDQLERRDWRRRSVRIVRGRDGRSRSLVVSAAVLYAGAGRGAATGRPTRDARADPAKLRRRAMVVPGRGRAGGARAPTAGWGSVQVATSAQAAVRLAVQALQSPGVAASDRGVRPPSCDSPPADPAAGR
jgi:hypothetical protein